MYSLVNHSQLLIKSPKARLCLILKGRYNMSYENPVVQVKVQMEKNRVQSQSYYKWEAEFTDLSHLTEFTEAPARCILISR